MLYFWKLRWTEVYQEFDWLITIFKVCKSFSHPLVFDLFIFDSLCEILSVEVLFVVRVCIYMLIEFIAEKCALKPLEVAFFHQSYKLNLFFNDALMQSQFLGHVVVKEGENVLDEGASTHIREQDVVGEVLGWDDAPEDVLVEQGPRIHRNWGRLFVLLNVLGVGLVVILLIPLDVISSFHALHELTKAQCAYRFLH